MAGVPRDRGVHYVGLALNRRGFDRALAAGCDEINFVAVTTETFSQRNQGASVKQNLAVWSEIASEARAAGIPATLSISAAFGCPYEGEVPRERVVEIAQRGAEAGPTEIIIAVTIGCAVPTDVTAWSKRLRPHSPTSVYAAIFTIRATLASPTQPPRSPPASPALTPASAGSVAARLRPAPPATFRLRIWSICCTAWVSIPALISRRWSTLAAGWKNRSVAPCRQRWPVPAYFPEQRSKAS